MFEQSGDVSLHLVKLVELERGIDNGEDFARPRMFIDEHAPSIADELFFHLEQPFSFQHDGKNVARRNVVRIVQFNQFSQQRFGSVSMDRFRHCGGRLIDALPIGNEPFAVARAFAVLLLPAGFTNVQAVEILFLVEQERVISLLIDKAAPASAARMSARLNIPFVHQR